MPTAAATFPAAAPIPLAAVTRMLSGDSSVFFFFAISDSDGVKHITNVLLKTRARAHRCAAFARVNSRPEQ
jgi:hypothetical protein